MVEFGLMISILGLSYGFIKDIVDFRKSKKDWKEETKRVDLEWFHVFEKEAKENGYKLALTPQYREESRIFKGWNTVY